MFKFNIELYLTAVSFKESMRMNIKVRISPRMLVSHIRSIRQII